MTNFSDISADPLYLTALASLGTSVPAKLTAAPSKGSIAVLPFVDMSGEAGHEHFTDGLTEDIITDLSNVPGFFVIARNSTFAYKGKPTDVRQIAFDLGVKYVLEGSARRAGQRLRINVQLIDAEQGGNHIWAERFDRELSDIFAVQDEVTRRIVETITGKLNAGSIVERRRPANIEAYDLCVRSRSLWWKTSASNQEALSLLERAVALDPHYAEAHWQLALVQFCAWAIGGADQGSYRRNALFSAERAVLIDPNDSSARWVLGYVQLYERRWDDAASSLQQSIRMNPNDADAHAILSEFMIVTGKPEAAMEHALTALRLNPLPPGWYYWMLGIAQIAIGRFEAAIATLRREETYNTVSRRTLATALALAGRNEESKREAQIFLDENPNWRISQWIEIYPTKYQKEKQFWIDAYRLTGLPE